MMEILCEIVSKKGSRDGMRRSQMLGSDGVKGGCRRVVKGSWDQGEQVAKASYLTLPYSGYAT